MRVSAVLNFTYSRAFNMLPTPIDTEYSLHLAQRSSTNPNFSPHYADDQVLFDLQALDLSTQRPLQYAPCKICSVPWYVHTLSGSLPSWAYITRSQRYPPFPTPFQFIGHSKNGVICIICNCLRRARNWANDFHGQQKHSNQICEKCPLLCGRDISKLNITMFHDQPVEPIYTDGFFPVQNIIDVSKRTIDIAGRTCVKSVDFRSKQTPKVQYTVVHLERWNYKDSVSLFSTILVLFFRIPKSRHNQQSRRPNSLGYHRH